MTRVRLCRMKAQITHWLSCLKLKYVIIAVDCTVILLSDVFSRSGKSTVNLQSFRTNCLRVIFCRVSWTVVLFCFGFMRHEAVLSEGFGNG